MIILFFLFDPAHPVFLPFHTLCGREHPDRVQSIEHHGVFIRLSLACLIRQSLRVRPMMETARMQRGHTRRDLVFTEEIAGVVENELIIIGVAMEKGNSLRLWILLERTREEATDDRPAGNEGRMSARGKMGSRAHDRTDIRSEEHTSELQSQSNLVCRL